MLSKSDHLHIFIKPYANGFQSTAAAASAAAVDSTGAPGASTSVQPGSRHQSAGPGESHMPSACTHTHGIRPEPVRHAPAVWLPLNRPASSSGAPASTTAHSSAAPCVSETSGASGKEVPAAADHGVLGQRGPMPESPVQQAAQPAVGTVSAEAHAQDWGLPALLDTPWLERMAAIAAAAASAAAAAVHAQQPAAEAPAIQRQPVQEHVPGHKVSTPAALSHTDKTLDGSAHSSESRLDVQKPAAQRSAPEPSQPASRPAHAEARGAEAATADGTPSGSTSERTAGTATGPAGHVVPAGAEHIIGNGPARLGEQCRHEGRREADADAECLASVLQASHEGRRQHGEAACEEPLLPHGRHSAAAWSAVHATPVLQQPSQRPHASSTVLQHTQAAASGAPGWEPETRLGISQAHHCAPSSLEPSVPRLTHHQVLREAPNPLHMSLQDARMQHDSQLHFGGSQRCLNIRTETGVLLAGTAFGIPAHFALGTCGVPFAAQPPTGSAASARRGTQHVCWQPCRGGASISGQHSTSKQPPCG